VIAIDMLQTRTCKAVAGKKESNMEERTSEERDWGGQGLKTGRSAREATITPFFFCRSFCEITTQSLPELNDNFVPECPVYSHFTQA
jgi:hypothetical protein